MSEAVRGVIGKLAEGHRAGADELGAAFEDILAGRASGELIAAFLMGLRTQGETVDDIVAGARVLRRHARPVAAPANAIDTCGTGGLGWTSLNTSTAAAFVAAGAGARVAKHGNRSRSKAGSADVLEALGVNLAPTDDQIAACFRDAGLAFMFAPAHHDAMKHVAPVRAALGVRTIFNMLGPLANPAGVKRQVLGVFAPEWVEPFAVALLQLGAEHAWVVHGLDGLDEISTVGPTRVAELKNGEINLFEIAPEDAGVARAERSDLRGGAVDYNAEAVRRVLAGDPGPFADLVVLNAGACLVVAGVAPDLSAGVELARAAIHSGGAQAALETLRRASHG